MVFSRGISGVQLLEYSKKCTVELKGVVVDEWKSSKKYPDKSHPTTRYLFGRWIRKVEVETDGIFNYDSLLAGPGVGNIGDEVVICYDPDDPDEYYFVDYYSNGRTFATLTLGISGSMLILSLVFFIYYNIPLFFPKKKESD